MSHYIRILGTDDKKISYKSISGANKKIGHIGIEQGDLYNWTYIAVNNKDGNILTVEKNVVEKGSLGQQELEEFSNEIEDCFPKSAVNWLKMYFGKVKIIYTLKILNGAYKNDNWDIITSIQEIIWHHVGGILQADREGFSNEDGFHILWQFDEDVSGTWNMAILNKNNEWESFEMDLGNNEHREIFMEGKKVTKS